MEHISKKIEKIIVIDKFIVINGAIYKTIKGYGSEWNSCSSCHAFQEYCKNFHSNICAYIMYPADRSNEGYGDYNSKVYIANENWRRRNNIILPGQILISKLSLYESIYLCRRIEYYTFRWILGIN